MKCRDYIISQIEHKETDPVPYTFNYTDEVARKLTQYYKGEQWQDKITPFMSFPLYVDNLQEEKISDIRARDGFGGIWRMDKRPWHLEQPPLDERSFKNFDFPPASQFVDPIYRDKEKAIKNIKNDKESFHVINMGWGIFEQTWRIRGFENALMDVIAAPDFYQELVDRVTELYVEMVKACADIPADAFLFGDDWGEQRGVIMGPDNWRKYIKPAWSRVYKEVHKQGKYIMSHSCGSVADIMPDIIEMGMDVLESVQPEADNMSPYKLKEKWGDRITFWGCLGSQSIIPFGKPAAIKKEINKLISEVGKGGGFIIAPAKPLQPETPVENAVAILESFTGQDDDIL